MCVQLTCVERREILLSVGVSDGGVRLVALLLALLQHQAHDRREEREPQQEQRYHRLCRAVLEVWVVFIRHVHLSLHHEH